MVQENLVPQYDSSQADIRLLSGDQGQGKTCLATALPVDDCYANLTGIINPSTGEYYKAKPLDEEEIKFLHKKGVKYHHLKHIRLYKSESDSKIVTKPVGWVVDSPIRIFSNYHFFGLRFRYIEMETIIENINVDTITNAWLVLDESVMTDKQDTMTKTGKMIAKFGAQARRRKLHTIIISQYSDMVNSRWVRFATTRVQCSYDKFTHMIDLDVNRNSDFMQSTSFYAPDYWKFYRHDEIVKQPQGKVDQTLASLY